jgi:spherulation-specific family 4 protein
VAINIYDELAALSARVAKLEAAAAPQRMRIAPVSYFRGTAQWDAVIAAKPALALINPGSGPGPRADALYVGLVPKAQTAGVPVFGYVHTQYGARPAADVVADVRNHKAWYGVAGIFVDTVANDAAHVAYYKGLCDSIRALGLKVVLNPGTQCLEEHAQMADFVMCSEGDLQTYNNRIPRAWEPKYRNLWHCVHSVSPAQMPSTVALAKSRGAGLLYVTDDVMPNPYDTLPSYWSSLCQLVSP